MSRVARLGTIALLTTCLLFCAGCFHVHHSERNRPGPVDVEEPPPEMEEPERVVPEDPGAIALTSLSSGLLEFGALRRDEATKGAIQLGAELSLSVGVAPEAHMPAWRDLFLPFFEFGSPITQFGATFGYRPISTHRDFDREVYVEGFYGFPAVKFGAGWLHDPWNDQHGYQLTLRMSEVFGLRWSKTFNGGWSLGYTFWLPFAGLGYVRSR